MLLRAMMHVAVMWQCFITTASLSKPGWQQFAAVDRDTPAKSTVVAPDLPLVEPSAGARPVSLTSVRLHGESRLAEAQKLNTRYLSYLEPERLLFQFRVVANLSTEGAAPYGGWENPNYVHGLINGHFTGHLLSALAFTVASIDGPDRNFLANKSQHLIRELQVCQSTIAATTPDLAGFVSAYSIDHIERMEQHNATQVWAPYYTLHKIMAGLLDTYQLLGDTVALRVLERLASFIHRRVSRLIAQKGLAWWEACLNVEFGGMNEVAYSLYGLTGKSVYLELAQYFYKRVFMDPLAAGFDSLSNNHANTHLPEVVGVARGWEVTQNNTLQSITRNFYNILSSNYSYATGGSSVNEYWQDGAQLGDAIATKINLTTGLAMNSNGFHTEETCTVYNQLKVVRHLMQWAPTPAHGQSYERMLFNGILGVQNTNQIGSLSYMTPLGSAVTRTEYDWWGFGTGNNSFWCCYGTTIEAFGKLGDSLFFETSEARPQPALYIMQPLVSASVAWKMGGVNVSVVATEVYNHSGSRVDVEISVTPLKSGQSTRQTLLLIRIPDWAVRPTVRGEQIAAGTFAKVSMLVGTRVSIHLGMQARLVPIRDQRAHYRSVSAVTFGPHVLAGLVGNAAASNILMPSGFFEFAANPANVQDWVKPTSLQPSNNKHIIFEAKTAGSSIQMIRLSDTLAHRYAVYFNVTGGTVTTTPTANTTCWSGKLEGGSLYTANLTIAAATAWCANDTKCGGFSAQTTSAVACRSDSSLMYPFEFKDKWGASRLDPNSGWTTWLMEPPARPTYVCNGTQCILGSGRVQYYDPHCLGLCVQ